MLDQNAPRGRVLALDLDEEAIAAARISLAAYGKRVEFARGNFRDLATIAAERGFTGVDGILYDLGFSTDLLRIRGRGLSFMVDEPLDMRFDLACSLTAREIINTWPEKDLADTIFEYGEERNSRRIAKELSKPGNHGTSKPRKTLSM